jgi:hypothetical protein
MSPSGRRTYGRANMTVDRRFVIALVIALLVVAVILVVARGPFGYGPGPNGPDGGCPPGHMTDHGCVMP